MNGRQCRRSPLSLQFEAEEDCFEGKYALINRETFDIFTECGRTYSRKVSAELPELNYMVIRKKIKNVNFGTDLLG